MKKNIIVQAKEVLKIEAEAVEVLINRVDENFERAIDMLLACKGRVIVTGMGKPGLISRKIAATLASTGTPALFLHPAEAIHGDLGMIVKEDVVIAISNSGETEEIVRLIPLIKRIGCSCIAMTGKINSTLAKNSDIILDVSVRQEACPLGLAPTASTTAALAMGDAIAIVLLNQRGFQAKDYAFLHPGGALGKKLMIKVSAVMRMKKNTPSILKEKTVREAILMITQAKAGAITVVDKNGRLLGIFTDGDLRRHYADHENLADMKVGDVMTKAPVCINENKLAVEALRIMQEKQIDELPVTNDQGIMVGILDVQDLLKIGIV